MDSIHSTIYLPTQFNCDPSTQWRELQQYTKTHSEAYFLKYIVNIASKQESDENRFQTLFNTMRGNLFGSVAFFPSASVSYTANDYIQTERKIRDFDLILFWRHVREEHPHLNLPDFDDAEQIRVYLERNTEMVSQITVLQMKGIFEVWSDWHEKYGKTLGFPSFKTEREIHDYLENGQNKEVIFQVISKESDTILKKTTRLPPEIKYFVNLEKLTFSNRKALVLPKEIFALKNLQVLNICHSELQKLSKKIECLKSTLQQLRLFGTQFVGLPDALLELKSARIAIENKSEMHLSLTMREFLHDRAFV